MGVSMARTPGGGSSKNCTCSHGAEGDRGMGKNYSGNSFKSPVWNDVKKSKSRMGTTKSWAPMSDKTRKL